METVEPRARKDAGCGGRVVERLVASSRERNNALRRKRDGYFLKGPITFEWLRRNVPDPTSRVVLVARAFMEMTNSTECVLTAKVWGCAGITDRYQRRRVLASLRRTRGNFEIEDRSGRPSVMRKNGERPNS